MPADLETLRSWEWRKEAAGRWAAQLVLEIPVGATVAADAVGLLDKENMMFVYGCSYHVCNKQANLEIGFEVVEIGNLHTAILRRVF